MQSLMSQKIEQNEFVKLSLSMKQISKHLKFFDEKLSMSGLIRSIFAGFQKGSISYTKDGKTETSVVVSLKGSDKYSKSYYFDFSRKTMSEVEYDDEMKIIGVYRVYWFGGK